MDQNLMWVLIVAIVALVVVISIFRYGQRGRGSISGPGGVKAEFDGSNQPEPGARIVDSEGGEGDALAEDETGRGAEIKGTKVGGGLTAVNRAPRDSQDDAPKA